MQRTQRGGANAEVQGNAVELVHKWQTLQQAHEQRADVIHGKFRHPGQYHPVYDFLFEYYPGRPKHIRMWHPGAGTILVGPQSDIPHAHWKDYKACSSGITLDVDALWQRRGRSFEFMLDLLHRTSTRPQHFDCFGLHEWAMVYKSDAPRHSLPLRLGAEGTKEVVESHKLKCTHYDAFRFFTPQARPLNIRPLEREDQIDFDQRACVHVTMDLYKWCLKFGPVIPGSLLLDALELAIKARVLDMEASPYDCRGLGFGVVPIETPEGKVEYVRRQRALAEQAVPIREGIIAAVSRAKKLLTVESSAHGTQQGQ